MERAAAHHVHIETLARAVRRLLDRRRGKVIDIAPHVVGAVGAGRARVVAYRRGDPRGSSLQTGTIEVGVVRAGGRERRTGCGVVLRRVGPVTCVGAASLVVRRLVPFVLRGNPIGGPGIHRHREELRNGHSAVERVGAGLGGARPLRPDRLAVLQPVGKAAGIAPVVPIDRKIPVSGWDGRRTEVRGGAGRERIAVVARRAGSSYTADHGVVIAAAADGDPGGRGADRIRGIGRCGARRGAAHQRIVQAVGVAGLGHGVEELHVLGHRHVVRAHGVVVRHGPVSGAVIQAPVDIQDVLGGGVHHGRVGDVAGIAHIAELEAGQPSGHVEDVIDRRRLGNDGTVYGKDSAVPDNRQQARAVRHGKSSRDTFAHFGRRVRQNRLPGTLTVSTTRENNFGAMTAPEALA